MSTYRDLRKFYEWYARDELTINSVCVNWSVKSRSGITNDITPEEMISGYKPTKFEKSPRDQV